MNKVILYIMAFFALLGGIDKIMNNKYGLGKKFDECFMSMGNLAMTILGIYSLAPVISKSLSSFITPIYVAIGADPSIFISTLLACDMGGYNSAVELAKTEQMAMFSGLIVSSMMGATISFTIPIGMGVVEKQHIPFYIKGVLIGIITIPIGCIVGGKILGMSISMILPSLLPIIILAILLIVGLIKIPKKIINGFKYFGSLIQIISTIGLIAIIIETMTGIVLIPGMSSLEEGLKVIGSIIVVLSGAYPMMYFLTNLLKNPLSKIGQKIGMRQISIIGLLTTLTNNIPMFMMMKDMDDRGKILNSAFAVSAAFTFGGQLGFVTGIEKTMIVPFIISKLVSGISAVLLAYLVTKESTEFKRSLSNTSLKTSY